MRSLLKPLARRLLREEWNIGVVRQTVNDIVHNGIQKPVRWFPSNSWRVFADPFCFVNPDDSITVLAEMLNHWIGKGEIWRTTLRRDDDPSNAVFTPFISSSVHLSYPSYFLDGGTCYAMMESYEAGKLGLWKVCNDTWNFVKVLIDGPVVDPTIYFDGAIWWLFCTFRNDLPNDNLYLFYSNSVLGDWKAHPKGNPVKKDRSSARPAGRIFDVNGMLIRPSQDSSVTYGGRLVLNRISELTTSSFAESPYRILEPASSYIHGIHTIASAGEFTIIDGKRWHSDAGSLPCQVIQRLHRSYRTRKPLDTLPIRYPNKDRI